MRLAAATWAGLLAVTTADLYYCDSTKMDDVARDQRCAECENVRDEHARQLELSRDASFRSLLERVVRELAGLFHSGDGVAVVMQDVWYGGAQDVRLAENTERQGSLLRHDVPVCPFRSGSRPTAGWLFSRAIWAEHAAAPAVRMDCSCNAKFLLTEKGRMGHLRRADHAGRRDPLPDGEAWCDSTTDGAYDADILAVCDAPQNTFIADKNERRRAGLNRRNWASHRCISRNWTAMLDDHAALYRRAIHARARALGRRDEPAVRCLKELIEDMRVNQFGVEGIKSTALRAFGVEGIALVDDEPHAAREVGYAQALRLAAALRAARGAAVSTGPIEGGKQPTSGDGPLWSSINDASPPIFVMGTRNCTYGKAASLYSAKKGNTTTLRTPAFVHPVDPTIFTTPTCEACCSNDGRDIDAGRDRISAVTNARSSVLNRSR